MAATSTGSSQGYTQDVGSTSYEEIMGIGSAVSDSQDIGVGGGATALSSRLVQFRKWLTDEAKAVVHPSVCIVNGEATDGTKNAPVLLFGPPPSATTGTASGATSAGAGRCGMVDGELDQALYDRTIGCQVRVVRELKKDDVMMTLPRSAMVTPDLVASSDAGRAVLACCHRDGTGGFWNAFENTTVCQKRFADKVARNAGTRLLVQILQERKKAEAAMASSMREPNGEYNLAQHGTISTRAPILAFLIHQRFSNDIRPPVSSDSTSHAEYNSSDNTLLPNGQMKPPAGSPSTFAPYVRTLPSAIPLPICWKRNELALLAGCIPGFIPLQEVAAETFLLASEFIALVDAGISQRFPNTFPPGLLTWERWVWAASVFTSRVLPVSCYLNKGEQSAVEHVQNNSSAHLQSPPEVWDELGVMIPLLDMLNHETEASQVTWEPCVPPGGGGPLNGENESNVVSPIDTQHELGDLEPLHHPPRAVAHKRVKKGSQLYTAYGNLSNQSLILRYGFAQISNPADEVRIGWGLADAVGSVPPPVDYIAPFGDDGKEEEASANAASANASAASQAPSDWQVYESADPDSINSWWSDRRLSLLEKEALLPDSFISNLKAGKKMTAVAYTDGTYHPIFLSAAVIGTMPASQLEKQNSRGKSDTGQGSGVALTKTHQQILRKYLAFIFARKLEKLLQNLNNGLKDHFNNVQLWTKVSQGGLQYSNGKTNTEDHSSTGWQTFFDLHAYTAAMELEKKYYAVGPDSCVLTLYDGHLRSLQASIDGISTQEKFETSVIRQLEELGFVILKDDDGEAEVQLTKDKVEDGGSSRASNGKGRNDEEHSVASAGRGSGGDKGNKRRNRKKGDRPPAIKLHIGNLAYTTKPADLFDFFAGIYGRENVLECHIPTERDSGRSRGFGFVTMPDTVAMKALHSGRKHEIDGRLLKVAQSNSAGAGRTNRAAVAPVPVPADRCAMCGYRPRYCTCQAPKVMGYNGSSNVYGGSFSHGDDLRPPPQDAMNAGSHYGRNAPDHDYYGGSAGRHRSSRGRRSFSRSPSPRRGSSRSTRDRGYGRDVDSSYRDRYGRSRSRSFSRERDRGRDRHRRGARDRSRDRSSSRRSSRGGERRGWGGRSSRGRSRSEERSRSRSYSGPRGNRDRKSIDSVPSEREVGSRMRSLSRSLSPFQSRSNTSGTGSDRKREGQARKRSRSRSRGRSSRRKRRRHARSRSRSPS